MDKKPPSTASKYGDTGQASVSSKGAGVRQRINVRMMQNVLLIWLDANIDEENNADCRHTVTQLRRVVNTVDTFTDGEECINFIQTKHNEKVLYDYFGFTWETYCASCSQYVPSGLHIYILWQQKTP